MNVSPRLYINFVQYFGDGTLNISVIPQVVTDGGQVVGNSGFHQVSVPEATAIARGVANGRTDGEWGNREIEQLVLAERILDQAAVVGRPAVAEVRDEQGNVTVPAVPAVDASPATYKPRFGDVTVIVW